VFEGDTWVVLSQLREKDKKLYATLCRLFKEMLCGDSSIGLGRSVLLNHELSGLWSHRISQADRVIYRYDSEVLYIFAIGGQFENLYHLRATKRTALGVG